MSKTLTHGELLQLKRWNTPTIYNGWERITKRNIVADAFNLEETRDFMPQMGPMVGYAVTLVIEPSNPEHREANPDGWNQYLEYVAEVPGPKVVVVQDLDKPSVIGATWGEVFSNIHRALGAVGVIVDGAIRDVDEMTNAGFKALARRLCVGHGYYHPVRWNCDVEVFGSQVSPGDLMHADKHGFMAIKPDEQSELLEASRFMDTNECETLIAAARSANGKSAGELLKSIDAAAAEFQRAARERLGKG